MEPRFPLYVVSYDRVEECQTSAALDEIGVDHHIVVEPEEYEDYAAEYGEERVLQVPEEYHEDYETYDTLGRDKSQGPGPARNFVWDHAEDRDAPWHWVMDDNIYKFYRFHDNEIIPVGDGTMFRCMEDFCLQYENVAMAGPYYESFVFRRDEIPPLIFNSRVYSCNLIRNDVPYEWKGRYNEDTDLSLRMLKDGWCTVQFCTFLQNKVETQRVDGGNTENFYKHEGTYNKSRMLYEQHPDVTRLVKKFGRWHHEVNYEPFKANELKRDPDAAQDWDISEYEFRRVPKEDVHGS